MKQNALFLVLMSLSAVLAIAEPSPEGGPRNRKPPREGFNGDRSPISPRFGGWVAKCILRNSFIKEANITSNQVSALQVALNEIAARQQSLETNITAIAKKQGALGKEILNKPGADAAPLLACVDEIAKLRGEQAKLSIQTLIVIRETLDDAQRAKVQEFLRAEGRQRMKERMSMRMSREKREMFGPPPPPPGE